MNQNKHVEDYLDYYLSIKSPKYAVALTGAWGCGKTFFIKKYLDDWKNGDVGNRKYHYITLNGLSSSEDIDSELFASMHPILSNPKVQLGGKIAKGLVKGVLKIDLDDGETVTSRPTIDFGINDIESAVSSNNNVFVFDDLERCKLDEDETLGYINYLVEHQDCSVIVLADMEKFNETNGGVISEKTIGQQFTISGNPSAFYDLLISDISTDRNIDQYFYEIKDYVLGEFKKTKAKSLRLLGISIRGLYRLFSELNNDVEFKESWIYAMIPEYIHLSTEYHRTKNELVFSEYSNQEFAFLNDPESSENVVPKTLIGEYEDYRRIVFSIENLKSLIIDSKISKNELTPDLMAFFDENNSGWYQVYKYFSLKLHEILPALEKEMQKIRNKENRSPGSLLHIAGVVIAFEKESFFDVNYDDYYGDIENNINDLSYDEMKKDEDSYSSEWGSGDAYAGCGYHSLNEDKFIFFKEVCELHYSSLKRVFAQSNIIEFKKAIENNDDDYIRHVFTGHSISGGVEYDYTNTPFLNLLNADEIIELLSKQSIFFASRFSHRVYCRVKSKKFHTENEWFEKYRTKIQIRYYGTSHKLDKWLLLRMLLSHKS